MVLIYNQEPKKRTKTLDRGKFNVSVRTQYKKQIFVLFKPTPICQEDTTKNPVLWKIDVDVSVFFITDLSKNRLLVSIRTYLVKITKKT